MSTMMIESLEAEDLSWPGASSEQLEFMREVYRRHVARSRSRRPFVGDVPSAELGVVEGGVKLRLEAAEKARQLLGVLRTALADAQRAGRAEASAVRSFGVSSGYRSASTQFRSWQKNFPRYYRNTSEQREKLPGGPHGSAAADRLAAYIGSRLGAPGFSLHNDGRALDFRTSEGGVEMSASTSPASVRNWRRSWLFNTLQHTAPGYGFFQNTSIDEPWHWEYRGAPTGSTQPGEGEQEPEWGTIALGRREVSRVPLLQSHRGTPPDLVLRWNGMPAGVREVDVVVHLHGYSGRGPRMRLPDHKEPISGLDWSDPDGRDPAPGRSRPTLGLLPRGNYFGGRSGAGYNFPALGRPGAVGDLVRFGLAQFAQAHGLADVGMARLILTAHSGGGAALLAALAHIDPDEMHVFDATYQDFGAVARWANRHAAKDAGSADPTGALRVLYIPGTATERHSVALRRALRVPAQLADRYRVEGTRVGHNAIPRRFGWRLLASPTASLPGAGGARPKSAEADEQAYEAEASEGEASEGEALTLEGLPGEDAENRPTAGRVRQPRTTSFLREAWSRYRCAEREMVRMQVLSHRTPVNPLAVDAFTALEQALRATGYQARSTWAYNCRAIRGTTRYSLHSYGIAVDIDPRSNPHRLRTSAPVRFSPAPTQAERERDVAAGRADTGFTPQQVEAVEAIRTVDGLQVFAWGGRWSSSHDSMHFQVDLTPDELRRGIDPRFLAGARTPSEALVGEADPVGDAQDPNGVYAGLGQGWSHGARQGGEDDSMDGAEHLGVMPEDAGSHAEGVAGEGEEWTDD